MKKNGVTPFFRVEIRKWGRIMLVNLILVLLSGVSLYAQNESSRQQRITAKYQNKTILEVLETWKQRRDILLCTSKTIYPARWKSRKLLQCDTGWRVKKSAYGSWLRLFDWEQGDCYQEKAESPRVIDTGYYHSEGACGGWEGKSHAGSECGD